MDAYEYIEEFKIRCCDVDFKDEMKMSTALSLMQEVASGSADELGFGYEYVKSKGCTFVVSNLYLQCNAPVSLGKIVRVKTWPKVPSRVTFGREYRFEDEQGRPLLDGTSRWCLIDLKDGKILQSKLIDNQDYSTYNTKELFENIKWKIPVFPVEQGEFRFVLHVANSEYDHNMHINNARYADYCLDCFSVQELSRMQLKSFAISYVKQCREGETLRFYRYKEENGKYLVQGLNEKDALVVQAAIELE